MNFAATVEEILFYFNDVSSSVFYPLVEVLHMESNEIQWEVLYVLQHVNPVSDMNRLIQRLRDDYYIIILLYQNAIGEDYEEDLFESGLVNLPNPSFAENLASEIERYNTQFNRVRGSVFPTFNSIRSYFVFTANMLIDTLPACTA
jgi:hypothetical protein